MHTLNKKQQQHNPSRYRTLETRSSAQDIQCVINNRTVISFCSNDYLGLANHPDVVRSMQLGAETYGVGSGASAMISGYSSAHQALEEALSNFLGYPAVRLFSNGYMANLGTISALVGRNDVLFQDQRNHASLIDAAILSRCTLKRYAHLDLNTLQNKLKQHTPSIIASDGVFSMTGEIAPLDQLKAIAAQHNALLYIDDAHGIGCLGKKHGKGSIELYQTQPDILIGTLGKAFGTYGAFVAASHELIETITQFARTYTYTTALPPALAAASLTSLQIIQSDTARRKQLLDNIDVFRTLCHENDILINHSTTPIQTITVGDDDMALHLSHQLSEQGLLVKAIRPPTVPEGESLLRITLSAAHLTEHIHQLTEALRHVVT